MTGVGPDGWRIVLAIVAAGGLLGVMPFALRRFRPRALAGGGRPDVLEIVAQRPLDLRHRIVVVRYRDLEHLLVLGGSLPVMVGRAENPTLPAARGEGAQP